jgi:glucan phosphoethanolaminetransferase (alkaline phosphatase superfamily)
LKHKLLTIIMAACLLFPILTTLAMLFYPGGTRSNPDMQGYRFFENFFSELGLTQSYAGGPQTASLILFTLALALAGAALVLYYCLAPSIFWTKTSLKMLSLAGSFFGIIAGLSYIGVAFTPADVYLAPHALFVQLAFVTYFAAVSLYAAAIFIHPGFPNKFGWVNLSFGILLGIYVWLLFYGPGTATQSGLVIQVTGQKLIAYAAVASMFVVAYGSQQVLDRASSGPTAEFRPQKQPTGS